MVLVTCVAALLATFGFSDDTLKAFYQFDDGSGMVAADSSANGNDAALVNSPEWVDSDGFSCLEFDQTEKDYLKMETPSSVSGTSDFTISLWMKADQNLGKWAGLVMQNSMVPAARQVDMGCYIDNHDRICFLVTNQFNIVSSEVIASATPEWKLVTAVRKGNEGFLYVNNVQVGHATGVATSLNGSQPIYVGGDLSIDGCYYSGLIDDFKLYHRALSAQEVGFHANNRGLSLDGDEDGDGLSNFSEYVAGSDMTEADADQDGLNDKQELEYGTDPNVHNGNVKEGFEVRAIGTVDEYSVSYDQSADSHSFSVRSADVWNTSDNFVFVAKPLTNNSRLTVKLYDYGNLSPWSKAGVMVRDSYDANSKYGYTLVSGKNGSGIHVRSQTGGNCVNERGYGTQPMWLTIVCHDGRVTSYVSDVFANGSFHWIKVGEQNVTFNSKTKVGLAVTSNNRSKAVQVKLSNLEVAVTNDLDGDNLTDWEEQNVQKTNEVFEDTEGDGTNDDVEIAAGTHPNFAETTIDSKTFHKRGLISKYFKGIYNQLPDFNKLPIYATGTVGQLYFPKLYGHSFGGPLDNGAASFTGKLYTERAGSYKFFLQSDDGSKLYINNTLVVNYDGNHGMGERSGTITLTSGFNDLRIEYYDAGGPGGLKMFWEGPNFTKQVIPASVLMHSQADYDQAFNKIDQDGDGLTDKLEDTYGSDKTKVDSNGDGLTDFEKYSLGLDAIKTDTDGDGISDYDEVRDYYSDPLTGDLSGTFTDVVSLNGADYISAVGNWEKTSDFARSLQRRGGLTYSFNLQQSDKYRVLVKLSGENSYNDYSVGLQLYVDGIFVAEKNSSFSLSSDTEQFFVLPFLKAGDHQIKLFWNNARGGRTATIKKVAVQSVNGTDNDGDGSKDWIKTSLNNTEKIIGNKSYSYVSPLCLEGKSLYKQLTSVSTSSTVLPTFNSADNGWFSYVPLEGDQNTLINLSFQNGGSAKSLSIKWERLNLLSPESNSITVTKGGRVKFTAYNDSSAADDIVTVSAEGENLTTTASSSVTKQFNNLGIFSITGSVNGTTGTITVKVIDAVDDSDNYCVLHNRTRNIDISSLSSNAVIESSDSVTVERSGNTLKVTVLNGSKEQFVSVRDSETRSITKIINVKPIRFYGIGYTSIDTRDFADGTGLLDVAYVCDPVIDDVTFDIKIFLAGVTFDDGSLNKTLTPADFNEIGETIVTFVKTPAAHKTATCHHVDVYEDGSHIGRDY